MIISLIGPPGVGKSTFAARFILEHPQFTYCSIDAFRFQYQDEEEAWGKLGQKIKSSDLVLLETSGLSWRLNSIFQEAKDRPTVTLGLTGNPDIVKERIKSRIKRDTPYPYEWDEYRTADYVIENINKSVTPIKLLLDVTNRSKEEVYSILNKEIALYRIRAIS